MLFTICIFLKKEVFFLLNYYVIYFFFSVAKSSCQDVYNQLTERCVNLCIVIYLIKIDHLKSGGSFGVRQYCVYEPQNSQKILRQASKKEYNLCCRECRYRLIVRICIVADGLYFSLCSPSWKLKVIRDLTRKNC